MRETFDSTGNLLPDYDRITRIGHLLRSFSLDELPELLNVIKGEMSIVGPRPLLPEYLSSYSSEQHLRHLVRPGITGLAQVSGRNSLTLSQKTQLDLKYVQNLSFSLDLSILIRTIGVTLSAKHVSHATH